MKLKGKIHRDKKMNIKEKVAKSLNILYQNIVNKSDVTIQDDQVFDEARAYINNNWPALDLSVMEFLAIYMIRNPEGKIEFQASETELVDLVCKDEKTLRVLSLNGNGIIVGDETKELAQRGD